MTEPKMVNTLLQANLNHARAAQDLLDQFAAQRDASIMVLSEPYRVPPDNPCWAAARTGREVDVAITWRRSKDPLPCKFLEAGEGYVAAGWGDMVVVGVYLTPSLDRATYEERLGKIGDCVRKYAPSPVLVAGDFNAWSRMWGSRRTNGRGAVLELWAASLGLHLVNVGSTSTFVRPRGGESIVDLTWATPGAAARVKSWRVATEFHLESDHRCIEVVLTATPAQVLGRRHPQPRRWVLSKLDEDPFEQMLLAGSWSAETHGAGEVEACAERLRDLVTRACDAAMPRVNPRPRRAVYWWSDEIARLHQAAHKKRRVLKRARRRGGSDPEEMEAIAAEYRGASKALRKAIATAKARAWDELLQKLDENPWGRPYQIVRNKLRRWVPPHTETLETSLLDKVLGALFPRSSGETSIWEEEPSTEGEWSEELEVSMEELAGAVKRMRAKNTAPGPNGVPGKVWALALKHIGQETRNLFNRCLQEGVFPPAWRRAKLVLLRKENKPADTPAGYRPICLLDEEAKLLERIIAGRLVQHLEEVGPDLHGQQFGFRRARSTVDAILCVRGLVEPPVREGGVVVGVALDISNAFNSLPWDRIGRALQKHRVPPYLRRVLRVYLSGRWLEYRDQNQVPTERGVYRGVPQGSVLGPHLWNLGYNAVLEEVLLPPGCEIVCYADDTLILAAGRDWGEAKNRASEATAGVVRHIRDLGLEVAPQKTEAIYFHNGRRGAPPKDTIEVAGVPVPIEAQMKYLGLTLDSRWRFRTHFENIVPRVTKAADSLARLLPNLGGPNGRVRRLYAEVVNSIVLYAAPVWAAEAEASRQICALLHGVQRRVAIRAIRGYRTTSHAAATALAGQPPLELLASMRRRVYYAMAEFRRANRGNEPPPRAVMIIRVRERQRLVAAWSAWLCRPTVPSKRIVAAVQPRLADWLERRWGGITFRSAQMLTGHGCFGAYLCRIGRERTARCHHCSHEEDSAQHTLEECPAWAEQRRVLVTVVGYDLSLPAVINAMLQSERSWVGFLKFCEEVLVKKEEAERVRRGEVTGPAARGVRNGGGGGAVQYRRRRRPPAHLRP